MAQPTNGTLVKAGSVAKTPGTPVTECNEDSDDPPPDRECRNTVPRLMLWRVFLPMCLFGFLRCFLPSDPFLYRFLRTVKDFTEHQVNNEIYPVWTYSYMCFLAVNGLLAELIGYKFVIAFGAVCQLVMLILTVWGESLQVLQLANVFYGAETAGQIIFQSYVFRLVTQEYHQRLTSFVNCTNLLGYFVSGILGQLLYSYAEIELRSLFYISMSTSSLSFIAACCLPSGRAIYGKTGSTARGGAVEPLAADPEKDVGVDKTVFSQRLPTPFERTFWRKFLFDLKGSFSSWIFVGWFVWFAFSFAGLTNNENYINSLFYAIDPEQEHNGFISSTASVVAAACSLLPTLIQSILPNWAEFIVGFGTLICAVVTLIMSRMPPLLSAYFLHISFEATSYFMNAVTNARIAANMSSDRYSVIFAMNMFCSLGIQTVMQLIIGQSVFDVDIDLRYFIYGWFYAGLALFTFIFAVVVFIHRRNNRKQQNQSTVTGVSPGITESTSSPSAKTIAVLPTTAYSDASSSADSHWKEAGAEGQEPAMDHNNPPKEGFVLS